MTTITVSNLPNINFYTGVDANFGGESVENRRYGASSDYYGKLSKSKDYNTYWSNISNSTFSENPVNYNNIGDIINATISYMNKFKNNNVNISVDKNILTFDYKLEDDLNNDFDNTKIIPASQIIDLLKNVNEMTFNKQNYYKNNLELKEITYARKKYPYNPSNTIIEVTDNNSITGMKSYDFSNQFVDYNYTVYSEDKEFTRHYMDPYTQEDGTIAYRDTGFTYTEVITYFTYEITDINRLTDRIDKFFDNNTTNVENKYNDLKTYYMSDLDTMLTLTLNTYSLSSKNLYTYFNFSNKYDNWFDNSFAITMNTTNINNNDVLLSIEPKTEDYFNVIVNDNDKPCGDDIKLNTTHEFVVNNKDLLQEEQTFKIINPSNIKTLNLSNNSNKIKNINLINNYNKRVNVNSVKNTNWIKEGTVNIENLIIGNQNEQSTVEIISGINNLPTLKSIDITNCNNLKKDFSISKLKSLEEFKAAGSNIKIFVPYEKLHFTNVELPDTLKTLILKENSFDNFNYNPTGKLINLTLNNVSGFDTKSFIVNWVNALENTKINESLDDSLQSNKVLYNGIVTNTNFVNINWTEFPVDTLCKFKYLGLNQFTGTVGIKGSDLTRKEYLQLRNVFGDELMHCGNYSNSVSSTIKFEYTLDENAYKKNPYVYYFNKEYGWTPETNDDGELLQYTMNILDKVGGNSLLDYLETVDQLRLELNSDKSGYEIELPKTIYTDNNDKSSMTKELKTGDIVLYKGKKLIFVIKPKTSVYNYIKLGTFIYQRFMDYIILSFNNLTEEQITELNNEYINK